MRGLTHKDRAEAREQMLNDIAEGMTDSDAAERYGYSVPYVGAVRSMSGIKKANGHYGSKMRASSYLILAELLQTEATIVEIAQMYQVTRQRVHEVLQMARRARIRFPHRPTRAEKAAARDTDAT